MSEKPTEVVEHDHFFPFDPDVDERGCVNACRLPDGTSVAWDVDQDKIIHRCASYEEACAVARAAARAKATAPQGNA